MAVDTAKKRFSMMFLDNYIEEGLTPPDGSVPLADRQAHLWSYAGIAFDGAVAVVATVRQIVSPILRGGQVVDPTRSRQARAKRYKGIR